MKSALLLTGIFVIALMILPATAADAGPDASPAIPGGATLEPAPAPAREITTVITTPPITEPTLRPTTEPVTEKTTEVTLPPDPPAYRYANLGEPGI